jgi:hypothetical protein
LNLSDNIKYIGSTWYSAAGSPRFKGTFHIPSKLTVIPDGAFCGLGSDGSFVGDIEIPQGITEIGEAAFGMAFKNRINLTLPQGVKRIKHIAFYGLKFASLKFNDDLERIEMRAFQYSSMPFQIELPKKLLSVGPQALADCGIEGELVIPESCLSIGSGAFGHNAITKLTLPSKLQEVEEGAFDGVGSITELIIPAGDCKSTKPVLNGVNILRKRIAANSSTKNVPLIFKSIIYNKAFL